MVRVAGADPGTSSLDLLVLEEECVAEQVRFTPQELRADPEGPRRWLEERAPFDLIAGPSGYGLPLVPAAQCGAREWALLSLVRADDDRQETGVVGFRRLVRSLAASSLPVVFLPGVLHLPTVPAVRKYNRLDLGTADKLCVAALALAQHAGPRGEKLSACRFCLVELGTAFTCCLVVSEGRIVDGLGGSSGAVGWRSPGAWDGELAYLLSPLRKDDLFTGGAVALADPAARSVWLCESVVRAVAGLQAITPFAEIILSGRLCQEEPAVVQAVAAALQRLGTVSFLPPLPDAWVKAAAQGAALLADGLAGGHFAFLVEHLQLRQAQGSVFDYLCHPRAADIWGHLR